MRDARFTWANADATHASGALLASHLAPGMLITLSGELGSGKTSFVRGVLRGLGWSGPVKSPTYTLVEHYILSSLYFYHFDFYRLTDAREWETGGFADEFGAGAVCAVEWPERVREHLPPADLALDLAYSADGTQRDVRVVAGSGVGERALAAWLASAPP